MLAGVGVLVSASNSVLPTSAGGMRWLSRGSVCTNISLESVLTPELIGAWRFAARGPLSVRRRWGAAGALDRAGLGPRRSRGSSTTWPARALSDQDRGRHRPWPPQWPVPSHLPARSQLASRHVSPCAQDHLRQRDPLRSVVERPAPTLRVPPLPPALRTSSADLLCLLLHTAKGEAKRELR